MAVERAVIDNPERNRYELRFDNRVAGVVEYRLDDGVLSIPHVEVLPELRGKGFSEPFLDDVFRDVRARSLRVRPFCWYARDHIAGRPQLHDLLA